MRRVHAKDEKQQMITTNTKDTHDTEALLISNSNHQSKRLVATTTTGNKGLKPTNRMRNLKQIDGVFVGTSHIDANRLNPEEETIHH